MKFRSFISKNPMNNQVLQQFNYLSQAELLQKMDTSYQTYQRFKYQSIQTKAKKLIKLSDLIEGNIEKYAKLITLEMGKPIMQSIAEVKKSAAYCRYYAENAEKFLKPIRIKTEAQESYYKYEPIGPVYIIAPFNFPMWLTFKAAIPQILLGNTILGRPSDSTPLTGMAQEELFQEAGFDEGQYQNIFSSPEQLDDILGHQRIQGVSFTGSTVAGRVIAQTAGKYLKRNIMELGGMDPLLVLKEANLEKAVDVTIRSRLANSGQICTSAKRLIIHEQLYESYKSLLIEKLNQIRISNPLNKDTQMGPMARIDLFNKVQLQIDNAIQTGAKLLLGGKPLYQSESEGNFYPPTVLEINDPQLHNSNDEIFGPVFTLIRADSNESIIKLANETNYGLGAIIISENMKDIKNIVQQLECGNVFVNEIVKSDQRLPFGGIKDSGYGRECSEFGIQSFANIKTVWIQ